MKAPVWVQTLLRKKPQIKDFLFQLDYAETLSLGNFGFLARGPGLKFIKFESPEEVHKFFLYHWAGDNYFVVRNSEAEGPFFNLCYNKVMMCGYLTSTEVRFTRLIDFNFKYNENGIPTEKAIKEFSKTFAKFAAEISKTLSDS